MTICLSIALTYCACTQAPLPCTGCESCKIYRAASGTFSDGSGSANYPDGADCKWMIAAPNGMSQITISFTEFDTEACCDFVTVYQCTDIECGTKQFLSELYGTYSSPQQITSTTGYVLVHFTTNHATQFQGFTATWTSIATLSIPVMPNVSHPLCIFVCRRLLFFLDI